jgi:hypothetical protein
MASPFRIFRKHMKALLVVFGVALIFIFVIGDPLSQYVRDLSAGSAQVPAQDPKAMAVRWDGGQLTNAEMDDLIVRRRVLNSFLRQVYGEGEAVEIYLTRQSGIQPRPLRVRPLIGPETSQQFVERSVSRVRIFAEQAAKIGMTVDDEQIRQYLDALGRDHVSRARMRELLSQIQVGRGGASIRYVFDALREELLADYYVGSFQFALASVMPQERWNEWRKVNDRIVIEAAPFPAANFLEKAPEPTPEELTAYYDLYKESEPLPRVFYNTELPSPTPGFKIPRKIELQYVRADFNQMLEKIKAEITEEEIQKYYDDNKDPYFVKPDTSLIDEKPAEKTTEQPAERQAADEAGLKKDTGETAPTGTGESAAQPAATGGAGTQPPTTREGDRGTPPPTGDGRQAPTSPDGGAAAPGDGDRSARQSALGIFRFAAFSQDQVSAGPAVSPAAGRSAGAAAEPAAENVQAVEPAATQTAAAAPVQTPAASTEQPAQSGVPTTGVDQPATEAEKPAAAADQPAVEKPALEVKPKEFKPLAEVRDQILKELATPKVHERLNELATQLQGELTAEFNKYFAARIDAEDAGQPPPPLPAALANLSALAEKHGLQYQKTEPMTWLQMRDDPVIGKLYDLEQSSTQVGVLLYQTLFNEDTDLYKPIVTADIDSNRYVTMKVSESPSRIPPLEEIRDQVSRAWRMEKAAELALKHAQDVAEKASAAAMPLADFLADKAKAAADAQATDAAAAPAAPAVEVIRTDPFSWLTGGDIAFVAGGVQQQPLRMGEPDGIVAAGPAFMEAVYQLDEGRAAAVLNHDHSIAYVVRLLEHVASEDKLREDYLADTNYWPGWPGFRRATDGHSQEYVAALARHVLDKVGFEELRPLDPREAEE